MSAAPDYLTTLAVVAIDIARDQLARYALQTDSPAFGVVDAADLLDGARDALTQGIARDVAVLRHRTSRANSSRSVRGAV